MSVVLSDLFRSHHDSEHSEKVTECPLCTAEEGRHHVSRSDLDVKKTRGKAVSRDVRNVPAWLDLCADCRTISPHVEAYCYHDNINK